MSNIIMYRIQIIILLFISGCVHAQTVQFTAEAAPNVLEVGEQFTLTYSSNQAYEEFTPPEIHDFDLLGGPMEGHSQNFSSVNGKVTTSSSYQYSYFYRATKEGKFTIPSATLKFKNKIYKSNVVNIEVVKGSQQRPSHSQNVSDQVQDNGSSGINPDDLFVRLVLDKKQVFIGEQILATVKIFTKLRLAGINYSFKGPDYTGFFIDPIETPALRTLQREAQGGDIYYTGVVRRVMLIPQKAGDITIQPFDVDVAVERTSVFDLDVPARLLSKPVKISVKSLPENAPVTFKGAVGKFSIASSLNNTNIKANEPLTYKLTIRGTGNLKLINEIVVNVPDEMEIYDPVINTRFDNALTGSKTFEYMIVPKTAGSFNLPAVAFTFFDVESGQYKTIQTQSYQIHVAKGENDSVFDASSPVNKEDVKLLSRDIQYIKTNSVRLSRKDSFFGCTPLFYFACLMVIFLFVLFLLMRKRLIRQQSDVAGLRLRKADKYARKRLKSCEALLKQGNDSAFYEEMLGAFWDYLSHKLNIPVSALSKESAGIALKNRNINQELIDQLFDVTNICEMARYGHGGGVEKQQLYRNAIAVITLLHQKLR